MKTITRLLLMAVIALMLPGGTGCRIVWWDDEYREDHDERRYDRHEERHERR